MLWTDYSASCILPSVFYLMSKFNISVDSTQRTMSKAWYGKHEAWVTFISVSYNHLYWLTLAYFNIDTNLVVLRNVMYVINIYVQVNISVKIFVVLLVIVGQS